MRLSQKYFFRSFCHVERSETSRIRRVGILRYTQKQRSAERSGANDKEGNTLIV